MVSLVNPQQHELREPKSYPPLGLAYLASSLMRSGLDVRIDNLAGDREISIDHADLFCLTYPTACRNSVKRVIEYIRERYPNSKIILGGPHPTVAPRNALYTMYPDSVVMGEAELFLPSLIKERRKYSGFIFDAGVVNDLDLLPMPARGLLDRNVIVNMSGIHGSGKPSTTVITSRGCPYNCSFCCKAHDMFRVNRSRSPTNVAIELIQLIKDYGIEHIRFIDDCFTLIRRRVKSICEFTKKLELTFTCITRADRTDEELLKSLQEGGCTQVDVGVESASPRLLALMKKGETIEQIRECVLRAKGLGIKVKVFLQYDLPTETEWDWKATLEFLRETKPDHYTLSRFTPLWGSEWASYPMGGGWFYPDDLKRKRHIEEIETALS